MKWLMILPLFILACQKVEEKKPVVINGAGSTFIYPLLSKWSYNYHNETKNQINYQSIGSGGGIKQVTERTVDFGATDRPLDVKELDSAGLFQFPVVIGGVAVVVNLPNVKSGEMKLDEKTLCDIFLGKIQNWNDERIRKLNPNLKLPNTKITIVRRSDGSGTTFLFTNYLSKACNEWKEKVGFGTSVNWPVGIGAKGNEGVSNYVKQNEGTIGYVEYAYAKENNLVYVLLPSKKGIFLEPSLKTFQEASKYANWVKENHFYEVITYAEGDSAYPITGAVFVLVPREKKEKNKDVIEFYKWSFEKGDSTAISLDYVPLPKETKELVSSYWNEYILK
ncbi:MAG: phosphate ABC transporter substrate-binding protein PstS [candidate division WOR-3 bacterium]|nr:phosphate ABC transporter substrate-binding protein PstS [candidate division WOR-3 bacterium]MCX7947453.1 phosphate ABC transporter substrate-binding protein PstS [candidate division WOR-3 bacterium]MDW8150612.1 phosphate ABC transporter substrate-binding protein PstS [candidate division WOR-3 bacterium]